MVYQGARRRKIDITSIFRTTFRKLLPIFITDLLLGIIVLIPLVPALDLIFGTVASASSLDPISAISALVAVFVLIVIAVFLTIKFWLTFPILMLENKGSVDSLKASWQRTKGHLLSIIAVSILYALAVGLPLGIINTLFELTGESIHTVWTLIQSVITVALAGVLPTIYYFNLKSRRR